MHEECICSVEEWVCQEAGWGHRWKTEHGKATDRFLVDCHPGTSRAESRLSMLFAYRVQYRSNDGRAIVNRRGCFLQLALPGDVQEFSNEGMHLQEAHIGRGKEVAQGKCTVWWANNQ